MDDRDFNIHEDVAREARHDSRDERDLEREWERPTRDEYANDTYTAYVREHSANDARREGWGDASDYDDAA